jgi:hypothetical protein
LKVRDIAPLWTIRMVKTNNTTGLDAARNQIGDGQWVGGGEWNRTIDLRVMSPSL